MVVNVKIPTGEKTAEITATQLLHRIRSDTDPFVLDVRTEEDFKTWRIEDIGDFETLNIPYVDFIEEPEKMTAMVPDDRQVVVLCGKGGASAYVADLLRKDGYDAVNIAGGMKSWGRLYTRAAVWERDGRSVVQFNRVGKGCLSHLLISGGQAAIVDPSRHIDQYLEYLEENSLVLKYIFDTHLHADHLSGGAKLSEATGAPYYLHARDAGGARIGYQPLEDGLTLTLGDSAIEVVAMSAPGHTPGSSCVLFDNRVLFTGDTLFVSSMGRPDLGGQAEAWVKDLYRTVQGFAKFPDDLLILPTHTAGPEEWDGEGRVARTLGDIRRTNPLMTLGDEEEFSARALAYLPEEPEQYQDMRRANLGVLAPGEEKMEQWELGRNRCAIEQAEQAGK